MTGRLRTMVPASLVLAAALVFLALDRSVREVSAKDDAAVQMRTVLVKAKVTTDREGVSHAIDKEATTRAVREATDRLASEGLAVTATVPMQEGVYRFRDSPGMGYGFSVTSGVILIARKR